MWESSPPPHHIYMALCIRDCRLHELNNFVITPLAGQLPMPSLEELQDELTDWEGGA